MILRFGRLLFWLTYPLLRIYLRLHSRSYVVIKVKDSFLLIKPWYGSGQWLLPGGGGRWKEDSLKTACREILEEINLHILPENLELLSSGVWQNLGFRYKYHIYLVKLKSKPVLKLRRPEIAQAAWFTSAKLPKNLPDEIQAALRRANLV